MTRNYTAAINIYKILSSLRIEFARMFGLTGTHLRTPLPIELTADYITSKHLLII